MKSYVIYLIFIQSMFPVIQSVLLKNDAVPTVILLGS